MNNTDESKITVELPSGKKIKMEVDIKDDLNTIITKSGLSPANVEVFGYRYDDGKLGTPLRDKTKTPDNFNTSDIVFVDKNNISKEDKKQYDYWNSIMPITEQNSNNTQDKCSNQSCNISGGVSKQLGTNKGGRKSIISIKRNRTRRKNRNKNRGSRKNRTTRNK